jgi:alpha-L-rhamnosidase
MKQRIDIILLSVLFCLFCSSCKEGRNLSVQNMTVELRSNPLGLDVDHPRLSWQLASNVNHVRQTAYQIIVAKTLRGLKSGQDMVWNTGKVESDRSVLIPYRGTDLNTRQTYYWKVKVWTNKGTTDWSPAGQWTMGLTGSADWHASWIGLDSLTNNDEQLDDVVYTKLAARYLRKEFILKNDIKSAKLYISGLGLYECYLNGVKTSEDIFAPTATDYDKTVNYNTYDVTALLQGGNNTIGVILGNGRYFAMRSARDDRYHVPPTRHFGFPKLLLQLEVEYTGGEKEKIISDPTWKINTHGPIIANNEYDGEEYDANLELPGWEKNGYDDSAWMNARIVEAPKGKLAAQGNPNIKTMEEIKPVGIKEIDGKYILDMGQNMVGWLAVRLRGRKDQSIVMRFAEEVNDDGAIYTANLRGARATNIYTPARDGEFTWCPLFTYQGFRYAEISGIDHMPGTDDFIGKVNYDEMRAIGNFETSDETINQIYRNAWWGIRGNYRSFPTDCPQRDERMPWLGDRGMGSYGESFLFDHTLLYEKWLRDIEDARKENGSLPDIAPAYWSFYTDNMTWPALFFLSANMLYEQRGDVRPIQQHYDAMKKWLNYMKESYMKDYIMTRDIYGDWCVPPESPELIHSKDPAQKTDGQLLSTSFCYHLLKLMSKFARLSNYPEDAIDFEQLAEKVKKAYNDKFLNRENLYYGNNTVTANLVSLMLGLVPEGFQDEVFRNLAEKTEEVHKSHVGVGLIGIQFLMRCLDAYGRSDLSYKIATNRTYPGWGYMIENGATTIWELWNGNTANPAMNSRNHLMLLGDFLIWCYENLAGIQTDRENVGFKKIIMRPVFHEGLDFVKASTETPYGRISSEWERDNSSIIWRMIIPTNTTATIFIPAKLQDDVKEGGKKPELNEGIHFIKEENGRMVYQVASGTYRFIFKVNKQIDIYETNQ